MTKYKERKLSVKFSKKENDIIVYGRSMSPNFHYLAYVFGPIVKELAKRGFDISTLKFSIKHSDQSNLDNPVNPA